MKTKRYEPESHRRYVVGCTCRACAAKRDDYEANRQRVLSTVAAIAGDKESLPLADVVGLLPILPEWTS